MGSNPFVALIRPVRDYFMILESGNFRKTGYVALIDIGDQLCDQSGSIRLSDELIEVRNKIMRDEEVRVIVVTGAGRAFLDAETSSTRPFSGAIDEPQAGFSCSVVGSIAQLNQPVISAINGDAIGLGLELALACDIRIATDTAHFGFPDIKEGLIPWDGGTQRLARVVGKAKAMEMILTGELMDAQEAHRIGLVSKVVAPEEVMPVTMDMAREMASKGPIALRYAKEAIHKGMDLTLEQGLRLEADLYFLLHTTKDRTEGITAFREKRTPAFEGR